MGLFHNRMIIHAVYSMRSCELSLGFPSTVSGPTVLGSTYIGNSMQDIHKAVVYAGDGDAFDRPLGVLADGLPGKLR